MSKPEEKGPTELVKDLLTALNRNILSELRAPAHSGGQFYGPQDREMYRKYVNMYTAVLKAAEDYCE